MVSTEVNTGVNGEVNGMIPAKREISMKRNAEMMEKLKQSSAEIPENVSLRKFIDINFRVFADSGKTTREIYEFLKKENVDVGSFLVFKTLYSKVKRSQKLKLETPSASADISMPKEISHALRKPPVPEEMQKKMTAGLNNNKTRQSKYNPLLPPVFLPGGVEAMIDLETGAKRFEIQPEKE
jgi:hypothetical protein